MLIDLATKEDIAELSRKMDLLLSRLNLSTATKAAAPEREYLSFAQVKKMFPSVSTTTFKRWHNEDKLK